MEGKVSRIKTIIRMIDDLLLNGYYLLVKDIINEINVSEEENEYLIAILSVTKEFKDFLLPERDVFLDEVTKKFYSELGEDRSDKILMGIN